MLPKQQGLVLLTASPVPCGSKHSEYISVRSNHSAPEESPSLVATCRTKSQQVESYRETTATIVWKILLRNVASNDTNCTSFWGISPDWKVMGHLMPHSTLVWRCNRMCVSWVARIVMPPWKLVRECLFVLFRRSNVCDAFFSTEAATTRVT
jgi:hypothetical protein